MLKKLKQLQNNKLLFVLIVALHIIGLEHITDIKSLFIVVGSLGVMLTLLFDFSIKEVLFIVTMFVFSFEKGLRGWDLTVVSQGREWWMHDFTLYFGLSLRTVLIFTLFLLFVPELNDLFKKKFSRNVNCIFYCLALFLIFSLISTVISSDYFLSFFGFIRIIQAVCLFSISIIIFDKKQFRSYIFLMLSLVIFTNGFIGVQQYINSGPIGLFLEDGLGYGNKGYFTTDGVETLYRVSALIGHPTFFASYITMLISTGIGFLVSFFKGENETLLRSFLVISLFLGLFAVYATFVRSSWFTIIFLILGFTLFFVFNNKNFFNKISKTYYTLFVSLILLFLLFFGRTFWLRILSSTNFISDGSGVVRISLVQEAIKMTKSFPFFGVGLNLSPRMMNEQTLLQPELRGFMFPVHNTFMLFFAEIGVPATIFFILFLAKILLFSFTIVKKNILYFGIWLGVISFILNAQVHTLFNQDPSFDLLFLFLGFLTHLCIQKDKSL